MADLPERVRMITGLAQMAFNAEEIAGVVGCSVDDLISAHGAAIEAAWPDDLSYARLRARRLIRACPEYKETVRRALAAYQGRAYYPLKLEARVYAALRSCVVDRLGGGTTRDELEDAWGYGIPDVMAALAAQFQDGMSWENWGDWHIDHIRPRSSFRVVALGDDEFRRCWALSNLQPLWARENMSKGARYDG